MTKILRIPALLLALLALPACDEVDDSDDDPRGEKPAPDDLAERPDDATTGDSDEEVDDVCLRDLPPTGGPDGDLSGCP